MRYRFVREHCKQFPITILCHVMRVASSGYYAWLRRPESPRRRANRTLAVQISAAHRRSRRTYGRRRIHIQLQRDGITCSRNRVARICGTAGTNGTLFRHERHAFRNGGHGQRPRPARETARFCEWGE